jgi:hypothetical protein
MCKNEDKKMQLQYYLQFGVAFVAMIGSVVSYVISLKVRHDILLNNEKVEKDISAVKDYATTIVNGLRSEYIRELGDNLRRQDDKMDSVNSDVNEINAGFTEKILHITNGKYRRTEVCEATMKGVEDRFTLLKELIKTNMAHLEGSLEKQISFLKERLK